MQVCCSVRGRRSWRLRGDLEVWQKRAINNVSVTGGWRNIGRFFFFNPPSMRSDGDDP